ncbi:hypothetical protein H0N99_01625 [Candidatus Micrarchaeota archaeon]|nr:hypothetical protein [Candidatus Micrarchaeota archaeon]
MVFGIGEGSIDIVLDNLNFSPGDMLMGTVKLQLNSPTKARNLRVRFWGERSVKTSKQHYDSKRHQFVKTPISSNEIVYEFTVTLDGEKEYASGEYPFQIKMPDYPEKKPEVPGLEVAAEIAQTLGVLPSPVRWYLQATLDLPKAFDINKKVQITLA